jgi:hypothetical protein
MLPYMALNLLHRTRIHLLERLMHLAGTSRRSLCTSWPGELHRPPFRSDLSMIIDGRWNRLVNKSEEAKKALDNEDFSITLFAPDDRAIRRPHHKHGHSDELDESSRPPHIFDSEAFTEALEESDNDDDDDDDKREKLIKILNAILHYHALPTKYTKRELADKSTVGTTLPTSPEGDERFRIRVKPKLHIGPIWHPTIELNFYSHLRGPTILAKNGTLKD